MKFRVYFLCFKVEVRWFLQQWYDQDSKNQVNQFTVTENIQICDFVPKISQLLIFHLIYVMIARELSIFLKH